MNALASVATRDGRLSRVGGPARASTAREPRGSSDRTPSQGSDQGKTCFNCGKTDHIAPNCPKEKQVCDHPLHAVKGSRGHVKEYCPYYNPDSVKNERLRQAVKEHLAIFNLRQRVTPANSTHVSDKEDVDIDIDDYIDEEVDGLVTSATDRRPTRIWLCPGAQARRTRCLQHSSTDDAHAAHALRSLRVDVLPRWASKR